MTENPKRELIGAIVGFNLLLLFSACGSLPPDVAVQAAPAVSVRLGGFTNFETEPARLLALSADGHYHLYALKTANNRLEIFDAQGASLHCVGELFSTCVDSEAARYYVVNSMTGTRGDRALNARITDLVISDGLTLAEIGRDHFLLDDPVDAATAALELTLIRRVGCSFKKQSPM